MLKVNRQYSQQLSINDDGTSVPISVLLDELLEEIFTHLSGADQLNCRLVCHLWNHVLCSCPRLLRKSVGMKLQLKRKKKRKGMWARFRSQGPTQVNLKEHPIISKLNTNPAIKVKSLRVNCNIYYGGDDALKCEDVTDFLTKHGINNSVEALDFGFVKEPDVMQKFCGILSCLKSLKKIELLIYDFHTDDEEEVDRFVFENEWNDVTFPSIENIVIEPLYAQDYDICPPEVLTILTRFFERMPNIKTIQGLFPYDEEFYDRFAHLLVLFHLDIDDTSFEIITAKGVKVPKISLVGDNKYDMTNYWQCLHIFHPELEEIDLSYISNGDLVPLSNDYTKVKNLELTLYNFAQTLEIILERFPNLTKVEVQGSTESCFFGHTIPRLPKLASVSLYLNDYDWNCLECVNTMTKAFSNVNYLELDECNINILTAIGANMTNIKALKFFLKSEFKDMCLNVWPEMKSLEYLEFYNGDKTVTARSLDNLLQQCPQLSGLHFPSDVIIKN